MDSDLEKRVLGDLDEIDDTLKADDSGDRASAIVAYLGLLTESCRDDLKEAPTVDERQAYACVLECLYAAQRVVTQHWETTHASVLVQPCDFGRAELPPHKP
jgi:hypothetical protein